MSDYGLYEAMAAEDNEPQVRARTASNKLARALYDVRQGYGHFLLGASGLDEFEDRWHYSKNDIRRTVEAHVLPVTGVMRRIHNALKSEYKSRHADKTGPEQHLFETDHRSDADLIPEDNFHGYLDSVDQGGPEKVEHHDFGSGGDTGKDRHGYRHASPEVPLPTEGGVTTNNTVPFTNVGPTIPTPGGREVPGIGTPTQGLNTGPGGKKGHIALDLYSDWANSNGLRVASHDTLAQYRCSDDEYQMIHAAISRVAGDDDDDEEADDREEAAEDREEAAEDREEDEGSDEGDSDEDDEEDDDGPPWLTSSCHQAAPHGLPSIFEHDDGYVGDISHPYSPDEARHNYIRDLMEEPPPGAPHRERTPWEEHPEDDWGRYSRRVHADADPDPEDDDQNEGLGGPPQAGPPGMDAGGPPPGPEAAPAPGGGAPLENQPAEDGLLDTASQAVLQMIDQETQEYQQIIGPLNQAAEAIQMAQQVEQQENPLDVTPPQGTVDASPGGGAPQQQVAFRRQQLAFKAAKHYDMTPAGFHMLVEAMGRRHYQTVSDAIAGLPPEHRPAIAASLADMFKTENPRFNHGQFLSAAGVDPRYARTAGNPRDRAGDAWADGRDRGVAEHGRHDLDPANWEDDDEPAFRPGHEPDYAQQGQDWDRYQRQEQHNRDWQDAYHAEQGDEGPLEHYPSAFDQEPAYRSMNNPHMQASRGRLDFSQRQADAGTLTPSPVLDSFEFPGTGKVPHPKDNLTVTPDTMGLPGAMTPKKKAALIAEAKSVMKQWNETVKARGDQGLVTDPEPTFDAFSKSVGPKVSPTALDMVRKKVLPTKQPVAGREAAPSFTRAWDFDEPHKAANFFTRKVPGWKWDDHLAAYQANTPESFTCHCGSKFDVPSYYNCRCGKTWNSYVIGSGGDNRTATIDQYLVREIPTREGVIMTSKTGGGHIEWRRHPTHMEGQHPAGHVYSVHPSDDDGYGHDVFRNDPNGDQWHIGPAATLNEGVDLAEMDDPSQKIASRTACDDDKPEVEYYGEGLTEPHETEWHTDEEREDASAPHAPGRNARRRAQRQASSPWQHDSYEGEPGEEDQSDDPYGYAELTPAQRKEHWEALNPGRGVADFLNPGLSSRWNPDSDFSDPRLFGASRRRQAAPGRNARLHNFKDFDLRDAAVERDFIARLKEAGVPVSDKQTLLAAIGDDDHTVEYRDGERYCSKCKALLWDPNVHHCPAKQARTATSVMFGEIKDKEDRDSEPTKPSKEDEGKPSTLTDHLKKRVKDKEGTDGDKVDEHVSGGNVHDERKRKSLQSTRQMFGDWTVYDDDIKPSGPSEPPATKINRPPDDWARRDQNHRWVPPAIPHKR